MNCSAGAVVGTAWSTAFNARVIATDSRPRRRLSANLLAPALSGKDYADFRRQNPVLTSLGAAFEVRLPLGEYQDDKLINLGQNRFYLSPQLGVLHTRGEWSFELTGTTYFFTDNDEFFNGNSSSGSAMSCKRIA